MCGATGAMKDAQAQQAQLAASQTKFYDMMASDFGTIFSQNQDILKGLRTAFEPIISAGPNQEGYSPAELTAMRTGSSDAVAQGAQNAQIAANAKFAGTGGSDLPSGAHEQISAMINSSAANEGAKERQQITTDDYATGRQNFFNAASALDAGINSAEGASSQFANSATGSGNAATNADQASFEGAEKIAEANRAWMGPVFGMIGSIGGAALGKAKKP